MPLFRICKYFDDFFAFKTNGRYCSVQKRTASKKKRPHGKRHTTGRKAGDTRLTKPEQPRKNFIFRLKMYILRLRMCISSLRMCIFSLEIKKLPA